MPAITSFEALLSGIGWNGVGVIGRPAFITYSFDEFASSSYAGGDFSDAFLASFQPFTEADREIAREALQAWADACGLTLFEVPAGQGDIRFGIYDFRLGPEDIQDAAGFAFTPLVFNLPDGAFEDALGGDIFIDLGQVGFDLLLHEIGHALGLKHPFEGELTLDPSVDDRAHTVMTYTPYGEGFTGLGSLDGAAVQFLYGPQAADGSQAASWTWDAAALLLTQAGGAGNDTLAGVAVADRISAGGGNDYVMARAGADLLLGEDGADTMAGGDGADTLDGGSGNDILDGDQGEDSLLGGEGDDDLWGFGGADTLEGGSGNDYLSGGLGPNRLSGGEGNDTLTTFDGASILDGGAGYDEIWFFGPLASAALLSYASFSSGGGGYANIEAVAMWGGDAGDTIAGGSMPDFLFGLGGADSITGGGADDELFGQEGADTIVGGSGSDTVSGGAGDDVLLPGDGADDIRGGSGSDTVDFSDELGSVDLTVNASRSVNGGLETMAEIENILGSPFGDRIIGDAADNRLFGRAGADTVQGGEGANYLRGDDGNDSLAGGAGFDDINGNVGDDTGSGGLGDDWVVGGKDRDLLFGDDGSDLVYGNLGADTCEGGAGDDTIRGGQQDDVLNGGAGDDYLSGDRHDDTVTGGAGADTFHSFGEAGIDRVTDFNRSEGDRVLLDPGTSYSAAQVGADVVVSMGGGGELVLVGVSMSSLSEGWITVG
ncbi:MAG: hypothetical protein ACOY5Y_01025 [Pseudomonadota bacterium]|jgi:Ca2+-binding RTX toxin-like protein